MTRLPSLPLALLAAEQLRAEEHDRASARLEALLDEHGTVLAAAARESFLDTAPGPWLDLLARELYGVERLDASPVGVRYAGRTPLT